MMSCVAYLDCVGGLAGDMLLAALIDAGADPELLFALPRRLGLEDVEVRVEPVKRCGLHALHVEVVAPESTQPVGWPEIRKLLERADVPERSLEIFSRLAEAEGHVHGNRPEHVHFHELGAADALIDICGSVVLLDSLQVQTVICSPLPIARGLVDSAHGPLPLPAPAVLDLLQGAPVYGVDGEEELVTPTGAAIVSVLASKWGPPPPVTLERTGCGAGSRELPDRPNIVRVILGSVISGAPGDVVLLETNLDDLNPELVPDAVERCFATGALDVWTVPAQMKKGRPGFVLSALTRPADEAAVALAMLEETSTLGVRVSRHRRYELEREERLVEVAGGVVRVKIGLLDGRVVNVAPEHDDCAKLARATSRSVKSVWSEALAAVGRP
jgi:uncharacterized protein (TIGR00299 family) protein